MSGARIFAVFCLICLLPFIQGQLKSDEYDLNLDLKYQNKNIEIKNYNLTIWPYFDAPGVEYDTERNQTFDGTVYITFKITGDNETELPLNFEDIKIKNVQNVDQDSNFTIRTSIISRTTSKVLILDISECMQNQTYIIKITYSGRIRQTPEEGLYRSTYYSKNGTVYTVYATQLERVGARRVFPCLDSPQYKAKFTLTVIRPKAYVVLSNTLENKGQDIGMGYNAVTFPPTPKMSTYLFAFVIGDFVGVNATTNSGLLVRNWAWRGVAHLAGSMLAEAVRCVESINQYVDIDLPLKKLDNVALPTHPEGAMENWGIITYQTFAMTYDPRLHTMAQYITAANIICHETAHQWFGDLVTNKWWGDILLHESFATWIPENSDISYSKQKAVKDMQMQYFVAVTRELAFGVEYYAEHPLITKLGSFGQITYQRGATILRMIADTITSENMQYGLASYLRKYRFSTATHQDLIDELDSELKSELYYIDILDWCGESLNLTSYTQSWLHVPHYPKLLVSYDPPRHRYIIRQEPNKLAEFLPKGYDYKWEIPFKVNGVQYWSSYRTCGNDTTGSNGVVYVPLDRRTNILPFVDPDVKTAARIYYDDIVFKSLLQSITSDAEVNQETIIRMIYDTNAEPMVVDKNESRDDVRISKTIRVMQLLDAVSSRNGPISGFVLGAVAKSLKRFDFDFTTVKPLTQIMTKDIWSKFNRPADFDTNKWNSGLAKLFFYNKALDWGVNSVETKLKKYHGAVKNCLKAKTVEEYQNCLTIDINIREAVYHSYAKTYGSEDLETLLKFSEQIIAVDNQDQIALKKFAS